MESSSFSTMEVTETKGDTDALENYFDSEKEKEEEINGGDNGTATSTETQGKIPWRRYLKLLAVKPVTIFYGLQFMVTGSVTSQLWIDKTCLANFGYNETVCADLSTNPAYENELNEVEKKVNDFNIVETYITNIPTIIATLYLGKYAVYFGVFVPYNHKVLIVCCC